MLKDKNILYIVHSYHSFQKDSIEAIAKEFKNVYVIVRYKPIAEISKIFPINTLKIHRREHIFQESGMPSNVHVYLAPLWYIPINFFYRFLGEYHFKVVERIINREKIKFDLIHAHFTWTSGYVGMKLKRKFNKPLILTIHSSSSFKYQLESGDEKFYSIWREADVITKVNSHDIEDLKKFNKRVYYIPNGFNQGLFIPEDKDKSRESLGLSTEKKILVSIGHLDECKGQEYLVKAIDIVVNKFGYKNLQIYIIGEGILRGKLEHEIKSLELSNNIFLIGSKLHKEIPIWVNSCDIFVMSSLNEGMPISMLEALACGKYFIGTKVGGIPEIIKSDKYGILVEPKNPEALAKAIIDSLKRTIKKQEIIEYSQNFSWENIMKQYLVIYKKALKEKND